MSNNHQHECCWVFIFDCMCSAEDMQGYVTMHHKRFKRKHTHTRVEILDIIQHSISCARRGERSADL